MNKQDSAIIASSATLVIGSIIALTTGQKWWVYLLLIFIIAPAIGSVGYALGKDEKDCGCPGNNT